MDIPNSYGIFMWRVAIVVKYVPVKEYKNTFIKSLKIRAYNQFHNTLRLSDVLQNFLSTSSEAMADYYLYIWYIRVAAQLASRLKTFIS